MSQVIKNLASGPVPPSVPTSFVTDVNSPSIPIANVENIIGGFVSTNNVKGIQTDGSSGSNTVTIQLTNRIEASGITTDGTTPLVLYSFPLGAVPGTYLFKTDLVAYNVSTGFSAAYSSYRCVNTNGVTATKVSASTAFDAEQGTFLTTEAVNDISGNNATLKVTGLAGNVIDWLVVTTYIFVN